MLDNFKSLRLEKQEHPELSFSEPFSLAWEYRKKAMKHFIADVHYALQIAIILYGEVEMIFDGYQHIYKPGDIIFTTCWEPHAYKTLKDKTFIMTINMSIEKLGQCAPFTDCDFMLPFLVDANKGYLPRNDIEKKFMLEKGKELFHLCTKKSKNYHYHAWFLIHKILLFVIEQLPADNGTVKNDFKRIQKVMDCIRKNQGKAPQIKEAAYICGLSPSRFATVFKETIGTSYGQFALHSRLSRAADELLYSNYTINELAERWGFCDACSFSNAFKKVFYYRPATFKKNKNLNK